MSYRLSPVGPETRIHSRYKVRAVAGDAYVRWSELLGQDRTGLLAHVQRWPIDRLVLTTAVGAKGSGYVPGYPLTSGPYFSIGAGVRF